MEDCREDNLTEIRTSTKGESLRSRCRTHSRTLFLRFLHVHTSSTIKPDMLRDGGKARAYDVDEEEQLFILGDDGTEDQRAATPSQHVADTTSISNGHIRETKDNHNGMPEVYYDDGPFDPPSSPESEEERMLLTKDEHGRGMSEDAGTMSPGAAENGFLVMKVSIVIL